MKRFPLIIDPPPGSEAAPLRIDVPDGDEGTDATVAAMIAVARDAAAVLRGGSRYRGAFRNGDQLYTWLRRMMRFTPDMAGAEHIRNPLTLLANIDDAQDRPRWRVAGDCDDLVTLAITLMLASDLPCAVVVVGRDDDKPFQHVLYATSARGIKHPVEPRNAQQLASLRLRPYDPQETRAPGNWPAGIRRMKVYPC